ncbi:MAG TPA: hypothetical protein GX010_02195 [Erysipelotrichaceae bacterium]|nr:hypothetical protein [Erysipelotrichaceae bacterium]
MKLTLKKVLISCLAIAAIGSLAACNTDKSSSSASSKSGASSAVTYENVTLKFGGSTSVEKIAKALTAAFDEQCQYFDAIHNHTGSGDAYKYTQGAEKNSATKLHMGFLSRELKDTEVAAAGTNGLLCKDGIVAVVNAANTKVSNLTKAQLKTIYETQDIKWSDITGNPEHTAKISRYTRDTASGTRDGFFTALDYKAAVGDDSKLPGASIVTSNGDMIAKVKNDENGIGYISLASLEGSGVTGLKCEGVEATEANVVDGSYSISRNFNFVTRVQADCTASEWLVLRAFRLYMTSREALTIVASKDGILTKKISEAQTWSQLKNANPDIKQLCS